LLNVHAGSILTQQGKKCLVQFDRPELGVELIRDIDVAHLPDVDELVDDDAGGPLAGVESLAADAAAAAAAAGQEAAVGTDG
jgi:hypothetical protein